MSARKKSTSTNGSGPVDAHINADQLRKAIDWVITESIFANVRLHGNIGWLAHQLVALAILFAWSDSAQMTTCFEEAARFSQNLYGVLPIATYQGMMRALSRYGSQLIPCLWARFQFLMSKVAPEHFRIGGWLPLAVDGSRFTTPRTKSNEQAFAAKNYGRGKQAKSRAKWKNKKKRSKDLGAPVKPQIWLTLVWHMGVRLPWCWKTGPSNASERDHLVELLKSHPFPESTLFCGDAGFTGYDFWREITAAGHSYLIRAGGNIRLLKNLGYARSGDGIVCLWPHTVASKKQPPIVLRLITITNERGTMYLVTNILDEKELSTKTLQQLYPLRWGIELHFRAVKQTYGRRNLRSRNADHATVELEWALVSLTVIQLLCIREQQKLEIAPELASIALAIAAVRHAMDTWNEDIPKSSSLKAELQNATKDTYARTKSKSARYKPQRKDKPTTNAPIIVEATVKQKRLAKLVSIAA